MKYRRPWLILLWIVLTAGLYWFYWHWKVNRELRDAFQLPVGPFLSLLAVSLLAVTVGWMLIVPPDVAWWLLVLILPAFVAWWRLQGRIEEAQRRRGIDPPSIVKPVGFILFLTLIFGPVYDQAELNKAWRRAR